MPFFVTWYICIMSVRARSVPGLKLFHCRWYIIEKWEVLAWKFGMSIASIEDWEDAAIQELKDYIKKSKKNWLQQRIIVLA